MKTVIILLFAILPLLLIAQKKKEIPRELQARKVEKKMFVIKGDNAWLKTGFLLKQTDKVEIKASGEIKFSNGEAHSEVGPQGYNRVAFEQDFVLDDAVHCIDPMEEESHAALIGKVKGNHFFIGKSFTITGKSGPLLIGINDCTFKGKYYNTGQFNVTIEVIHTK